MDNRNGTGSIGIDPNGCTARSARTAIATGPGALNIDGHPTPLPGIGSTRIARIPILVGVGRPTHTTRTTLPAGTPHQQIDHTVLDLYLALLISHHPLR
jgi:hypothetical protein